MAFAASMVWEVRAGGSNANGGGFDPTSGVPGTDYSQQDAAQVAFTDLVIDGATNTDCTSAANPFTAAHVGNVVNVTGGTGFTVQRVQIMSVTAGVARMDKSLGTLGSTGGTGNLGGAIASPGLVAGLMVGGNKTHQKSDGVYTITNATANVVGGCVTLPAGASASVQTKWFGYQTTRGDGGTKPIIRADGVITTFTLFTTGSGSYVENIEVDGNSRTSSRGFSLSSNSAVYKCRGRNCTNNAFSASAGHVVLCEATGCSTGLVFSGGACYGCVAYSNSSTGFSLASGAQIFNCLSINNTSGYGFIASAGGAFINCTAYGNGLDGFRLNANALANLCINCLAVNNTAYGFNASAVHNGAILINCAGYTTGTGNINSTNIPAAQQFSFSALSASPFNDAAGGDFSLNMTASAGDTCRQGGVPGAFPGVSTTGYPDIGCVQEGGVRAADITAIQSGLATQASVNIIDDFLDTEIAAIKAKTDNLPSDPADASDIATAFTSLNTKIDTIDDFLDTEIAAIKAKTDNLPADPADASDIAALVDALPTAAENADAIWDEILDGNRNEPFSAGNMLFDLASGIVSVGNSLTTVVNRIGAFTGSGVNTILGFFRALMRKDGGITTPSDVGGAYSHTTDSNEATADALAALNNITAAQVVTAIKADTEWKTILANAEGDWTLTLPGAFPGTGTLVLKSKDGLTTFVTFTLTFNADGVVTERAAA